MAAVSVDNTSVRVSEPVELMDTDLDPQQLKELYKWIDTIPLSRPKKNISRDFSDGVLMSELINHFVPHLVELHNYSSSNSQTQKAYNWNTINQKVFRRLGFSVSDRDIDTICNCQRGAIERVLLLVRDKIALYQERQARGRRSPAITSSGVGGGRNSPGPRKRRESPDLRSRRKNASPSPNGRRSPERRKEFFPYDGPSKEGKSKGGSSGGGNARLAHQLEQKETIIHDLRETVEILQVKVKKLEQLMYLKNEKIKSLTAKVEQLENGY